MYRTGIRRRRRHDGRPRRYPRHPERPRPVSRCCLWRRATADVLVFPGNLRATRRPATARIVRHGGRGADSTQHLSIHDAASRPSTGLGSVWLERKHGIPHPIFIRHEQYEIMPVSRSDETLHDAFSSSTFSSTYVRLHRSAGDDVEFNQIRTFSMKRRDQKRGDGRGVGPG